MGGMEREWVCKYWYWALLAIIIVSCAALVSIFRSYEICYKIIEFFKDWSVALGAAAAVILATAAFMTIRHGNEQERTRRKDELSKERRDRDTSLLNEIIDWAVEIVKIGVPPIGGEGLVVLLDEAAARWRILDILGILRNNFRAMIAKSLYISKIGLAFGEKLKSSIAKLDENLRKQDDIIQKCRIIAADKKTDEFDAAWDELIGHWDTLGDSAANVIDEAVIEKLNVLNI